jgi:hypothetical protein
VSNNVGDEESDVLRESGGEVDSLWKTEDVVEFGNFVDNVVIMNSEISFEFFLSS